MKNLSHKLFSLALISALLMLMAGCGETSKESTDAKSPAKQAVEIPTYKMTTQIPENVLIPDKVETRLGTLEFFDGVPSAETAEKSGTTKIFRAQ